MPRWGFTISTGDLGEKPHPFVEIDVSGPEGCIESLRRDRDTHGLIDRAGAGKAGARARRGVVRAQLARWHPDVSAMRATACTQSVAGVGVALQYRISHGQLSQLGHLRLYRAARIEMPAVAKSPSWKPPLMCANAVRAPGT